MACLGPHSEPRGALGRQIRSTWSGLSTQDARGVASRSPRPEPHSPHTDNTGTAAQDWPTVTSPPGSPRPRTRAPRVPAAATWPMDSGSPFPWRWAQAAARSLCGCAHCVIVTRALVVPADPALPCLTAQLSPETPVYYGLRPCLRWLASYEWGLGTPRAAAAGPRLVASRGPR